MDLYIEIKNYDNIINHCTRKLNGNFFDGETKEKQAFGLLIGEKKEDVSKITRVVNLKKNYRFEHNTALKMNSYIEKYAIPGGIKISERAWSVDPLELNNILIELKDNEKLLGTYHMHSDLSWEGDFPKNLPTELDKELNVDSGLINLIVYIGQNETGIRAFYESDINNEYNFILIDKEGENEYTI